MQDYTNAPDPAPAQTIGATAQSASDMITDRLGLEKIEGFSARRFFREIFRRHSADGAEALLSVGAPGTTPPLSASMAELPSPWLFFRVLLGTLLTYGVFREAWQMYANVNVIPGLIMVGSFAVPLTTLVLFFELNTPRNLSLFRTVQLLAIGGATSLLLSLFLYDVTPLLGILGDSAAGVVEEVGKLAALLLALRLVPVERYRFRLNWLLLGAAIGAGFAAFESAGYALRIGLNVSDDAMLDNITTRGLLSPLGHIPWSAIAAAAYWAARRETSGFLETVKHPRFLRMFAIPVALHAVWDFGEGGPFFIKYLVLGFIAWVVVLSLVQTGLRDIASECASSGATPIKH